MLESPFQSCGKPCSPHVTDEGNRGSERRKDFSQVLNKKEQMLWMTYGKASWPGYVLHLHVGHANMEAGISLSTLVINLTERELIAMHIPVSSPLGGDNSETGSTVFPRTPQWGWVPVGHGHHCGSIIFLTAPASLGRFHSVIFQITTAPPPQKKIPLYLNSYLGFF